MNYMYCELFYNRSRQTIWILQKFLAQKIALCQTVVLQVFKATTSGPDQFY